MRFIYDSYISFFLFFFLSDSPANCILIARCTILSRIASATVFSPIIAYQPLTGSCEVMMVDLFACRSSIISRSEALLCWSKGWIPKSSSINKSCFSIFKSSFTNEPSAFPPVIRSLGYSKLVVS